MEVAESIDAILIRSRRRELIERLGPQAAERYLPTEDPHAFLLPESRLEPSERWWQKVFVTLPWIVFACMVMAPMVLVRTNLPWLRRRAEEERWAAVVRGPAAAADAALPGFQVISFTQIPDVLERPWPTVLLLFDPGTFASKLFVPTLRDLEAALRGAGLRVCVTALDLGAEPGPPDDFLLEYPRALAPHLQLVLPRAREGEAGVVDYEGRWDPASLVEAARGLAGPGAPEVPLAEVERLADALEKLRDGFFEMLFVEDTAGPTEPAAAAARAAAVAQAEQEIDLDRGLREALASCDRAAGRLAERLRAAGS